MVYNKVQEKWVNPRKSLHLGEKFMYKFERYRQIGLSDFNQPFGLKMDPKSRNHSVGCCRGTLCKTVPQ